MNEIFINLNEKLISISNVRNMSYVTKQSMGFVCHPPLFNPLAYTDVPETAGLARSINTQPAVRRNSETNPTSQHNRGMY